MYNIIKHNRKLIKTLSISAGDLSFYIDAYVLNRHCDVMLHLVDVPLL